MNKYPILFNTEMVRAILEGRKTQTRRVIKGLVKSLPDGIDYSFHETNDGAWEVGYDYCDGTGQALRYIKCPYGQPGDRLWVKESIYHSQDLLIRYKADNAITAADYWPWKRYELPAMFCPKGLSRITLEVTDVRVQRVQEISDAEAIEEGVDRTNTSIPGYATKRFEHLWNSINAKRGYGWDVKPWVWAITFKVLP